VEQISFVTAHFSDFGWTELWLKRIKENTPSSAILEFLIINQDRTEESKNRLESLDPRIRVVQYPKSERHFAITGHDHAAVLNAVMHDARGQYICLFDSDAHPTSPKWFTTCEQLLNQYDAVLAQEPYQLSSSLSHPSFMLFRKEHTKLSLAFDDLLFEQEVDTGRTIYAQLCRHGLKVFLAPATRAFNGRYGIYYLDSVYHHEHGSFHAAGERLTSQLGFGDAFFRNIVVSKKRYTLSPFEKLQLLSVDSWLFGLRVVRRLKRVLKLPHQSPGRNT
jgi:hypothetical protein